MKKTVLALTLCILSLPCFSAGYKYGKVTDKTSFIEGLLGRMTLEEKIEQCDLVLAGADLNAPSSARERALIVKGAGAVFNVKGAALSRQYQKVALEESRLGIPLLFGFDCIHGMQTTFPIPLASACSWDMALIEMADRASAEECAVQGVNWVFTPMLDIARDARWGRIAEGPGEDPFLGAAIARARVRGYQGSDLAAKNTVATCVKHYVTYGAAESGRDYNAADMSEARLREVYLPPYQAAFVDSKAASVMASFNTLNGVPLSCNKQLLRDVLKTEYGFEGFVVSDFEALMELLRHKVARDTTDAARVSMNGGMDMDMKAGVYRLHLKECIEDGSVDIALLDDAVRRILGVKYDLGLFDDPYRYIDEKLEQKVVFSQELRDKTREVAKRSIVLLKNDGGLLPLSKTLGKIALIGEVANDKHDMNGCWAPAGSNETVTILEGLQKAVPATDVAWSEGCKVVSPLESDAEALAVAKDADVVVMTMGEKGEMSGEGMSRVHIEIPAHQMALFRKIKAMGKKVVVLLTNGRPLAVPELAKEADAILETWFLGTQAGYAVADVLFGDYNPSAKLTTTFPQHVGQEPMYYGELPTGRPYFQNHEDAFRSKFRDVPFEPVYPFGYGLSYTTFEYSGLKISSAEMDRSGMITVSVDISNTGSVAGEEIVQMYIEDMWGTVSRPMKELKGFEKIALDPGQTRTVSFVITDKDLQFWKEGQGWISEPGKFRVMVGRNSVDVETAEFELTD